MQLLRLFYCLRTGKAKDPIAIFIEEPGTALVEQHIAKRKTRPQTSNAADSCDEIRPIRHLPTTSKRGLCHICTYKRSKNVSLHVAENVLNSFGLIIVMIFAKNVPKNAKKTEKCTFFRFFEYLSKMAMFCFECF